MGGEDQSEDSPSTWFVDLLPDPACAIAQAVQFMGILDLFVLAFRINIISEVFSLWNDGMK